MTEHDAVPIYSWENCPNPIKEKVNNILAFFRKTLGKDLTGFYLHGSLAQGCFNPKISDIDFLAITEGKLTVPEKQTIIQYLRDIDSSEAAIPIEMSVVTSESLKNPVYPSPFELHYSRASRDDYTGGKVGWEEQRADTDLPAHYLAIRERGICLYGQPIKDAIPESPQEMVIASIVQDLHWIRQQVNSLPFRHIVLNPCRALAYAKEGKYLSKKEGGEWGLRNLPPQYTPLIEKALTAYSGADDALPPSLDVLTEFINYTIRDFIYIAAKTDAENLFFKGSY